MRKFDGCMQELIHSRGVELHSRTDWPEATRLSRVANGSSPSKARRKEQAGRLQENRSFRLGDHF